MTITEPVEPNTTAFEDVVSPLFLGYAMSVITDRALPDVRDGLKPVHRRILWSMYTDGFRPDRAYVKCAKIVGSCIGSYHPHGDSALYGALVRLAQKFSLSVPLIDPHGNFGSPSDDPAAMRYTEARLAESAMALLDGISENTVDMMLNFDGSTDEPTVLPARFPNLLVNGLEGIAVGMATKIPPHNLGEVCAAAEHLIRNPQATTADLMAFVQGPDFPTGGQILEADDLVQTYETGRGTVRLRAVAAIEGPRAKAQIVVTEIPYQTSVDDIAAKAVVAVEAGQITGIRDIRNESAGGQTRLVFDLKSTADPELVLNQLFKRTPMQLTYGMNMVALVDGVPRQLGLRAILGYWVEHQEEVVTRRTQFRLDKDEARLHIVEGLIRAIDMIDAIIALIRRSPDRPAAKTGLMESPFDFSEIQATHILDMALGRLTQLGTEELLAEHAELVKRIKGYQRILRSKTVLRDVIVEELGAIAETHTHTRRTALSGESATIDITAVVADDPLYVTVTARGYLSAAPKGGRGNQVANPGDADTVVQVIDTSTLGTFVLFTSAGKAYKATGVDIPERKLTAAQNLWDFGPGERIVGIEQPSTNAEDAVVFVTAQGAVKRVALTDFTEAAGRRDGLVAVKLDDDDVVVHAGLADPDGTLLLFTRRGQSIRFATADARVMGRSAGGPRAIKLVAKDTVTAALAIPANPDPDLMALTITTTKWAKRTRVSEFPSQARGGRGTIGVKVTPRAGDLAAAILTDRATKLLVLDADGLGAELAATDAPIKERNTTGTELTLAVAPARIVNIGGRAVVEGDEA